jgi:hypothetical protein
MSLDSRRRGDVDLEDVIDHLPFSTEWANEMYLAASGANSRHQDMVKTHRDGWTGLARAVREGLGDIADAIRARR